MSTLIPTAVAAPQTLALVPAADLFSTGTSLGSQTTTLFISLGAAVIAWFMLKQLAKVNTFLGALIAIAGALVLFWGLRNVTNTDLTKPLDDTAKTVTKGMEAPHPAGDRASVFLETGRSA